MTKGIWVLAIALAFVAGTLVTGTITWAQGGPGVINPNTDTDGDGVPDFEDSDDDNDGLTDEHEENITDTSPTLVDSDGDGLSDSEELVGRGLDVDGNPIDATDPTNDDSDGDGFTDRFEKEQGSDPNFGGSTPVGPSGT